MNVLVDTPIWSLGFRRKKVEAHFVSYVSEFKKLVLQGRVQLLGAIRQEILSGIPHPLQFEKVKQGLRPFPDIPLETQDFELAAEFCNTCRGQGIQGSATDYLICAVAFRHQLMIFTLDRDFDRYASYLDLQLHSFPNA